MSLSLDRLFELEKLPPEQIKSSLNEAEYAEYLQFRHNADENLNRFCLAQVRFNDCCRKLVPSWNVFSKEDLKFFNKLPPDIRDPLMTGHNKDWVELTVQVCRVTGLQPSEMRKMTLALFMQWIEKASRIASKTKPAIQKPPPLADGPRPPKIFTWDSASVELQPKPYSLLELLWCAADRKATIAEIEKIVWGDESESDGRMKSAITRVNNALLECKCPLQIHVSGKWLTLSQ